MPDVVHEAIDDVRRGAENGVTITADVGARPEVRSDRVRVLQIVTNLLGNAVKFARGEVRCSARCDGGSWIVEVEDDGPGIPPEDLPHVFEPFFRGRGRAPAEAGGTGLGLPISAQLARLLGGSLELQSGPRGGTIARLVLGGGEDDRPAEDA